MCQIQIHGSCTHGGHWDAKCQGGIFMMLSLTGDWMEREREITFASWQLCPGPILAHHSGSPRHFKIFPALILCTLPRDIPGLFNTINATTSNFWRRFTCHIWKETWLESLLQLLRCSSIQPEVKGISLVTISVQIFCNSCVTGVHHGESNEVWQWEQNTAWDSQEMAGSIGISSKSQCFCTYAPHQALSPPREPWPSWKSQG